MKHHFLAIAGVTLLATVNSPVLAQENYVFPSHHGIEYRIAAGFNIGASAPMGIPAEIRKITDYQPTLNLSLGASATKMLSDRWGISAGVTVENKGMQTGIETKNYHLTMNVIAGDNTGTKTGYFTGRIKNKSKISYLTIPVTAVFRLTPQWQFEGGAYFSYAFNRSFNGQVSAGKLREDPLHPVIAVSQAEYDYSSDIRRIDAGLILGAQRRIYNSLAVRANLQWGLPSTLSPSTRKIDMNTYNIYLNLALVYGI
ncbi:MAG: PorT family protein [Prevotella sp.]|nr:PorT family protein [Prevotella sp.]